MSGFSGLRPGSSFNYMIRPRPERSVRDLTTGTLRQSFCSRLGQMCIHATALDTRDLNEEGIREGIGRLRDAF